MEHSGGLTLLGLLFILSGLVAQLHLRVRKLEERSPKHSERLLPFILFGLALVSFVARFVGGLL